MIEFPSCNKKSQLTPVYWQRCDHDWDNWANIPENLYGLDTDQYKYRVLYTYTDQYSADSIISSDTVDKSFMIYQENIIKNATIINDISPVEYTESFFGFVDLDTEPVWIVNFARAVESACLRDRITDIIKKDIEE